MNDFIKNTIKLIQEYQNNKLKNLNDDLKNEFSENYKKFKDYTDYLIDNSNITVNQSEHGRWQNSGIVMPYLWNRYSSKSDIYSNLVLGISINQNGLNFNIDLNINKCNAYEKIVANEIYKYLLSRAQSISNDHENYFKFLKSDNRFHFVLKNEYISSNDTTICEQLIRDLYEVHNECLNKFYKNNQEIEFCIWSVSVGGLTDKTLKIYHDAIKRIYDSLINNEPYISDKTINNKSIFDINSVEEVTSIIVKIESLGQGILTNDNYKHLKQALNKYLSFLNDESIAPNHWIFQCNPKIYNLIDALNVGHVTSWKVAAHKDRIKIGDKIILWQTGENSGCYALAEVASAVHQFEEDEVEKQYYLKPSENKITNRVKIKIIKNMADRPVLSSQVSKNEVFSGFKAGNQGTNFEATEEEYLTLLNWEQLIERGQMNSPLNQILFGPPGTGKTYSTVIKALAIIEDKSEAEIESEDYPRLKKRYNQYVKEGQIIFTTFHQSLAYEDFVEGIKPIEPEKEGDSISYKVEEGIFKRLCIEAGFSLAKESSSVLIDHVVDFSLAFDEFSQRIEEKLSSGETVELTTKNGGKVIVDGISSQGNIIVKHVGGSRTYTVSKSRLAKLQEGIDDLEEVSNINDEFRAIIGGSNSSAYWSVLNSIQEQSTHSNSNRTPKKYSWSDKVQVVKSLNLSELSGKTTKPYILIIDEINRGNVSAIFGELITLIEQSKRAGNEESLEIILPYSKEPFFVPNNLYIIGTMNTADRSVEALDSALRRRFSFSEMPPEPELIEREGVRFIEAIDETIDLVNLLMVINERIEVLLDKDHLIGHSYFMKVTDIDGLRHALYNEIIPLLQEYFFGDYGKISMVLGEGFCQAESANKVKFANASTHYDEYDYSDKLIYSFPNHKTDSEFIDAINKLLNKPGDESQ